MIYIKQVFQQGERQKVLSFYVRKKYNFFKHSSRLEVRSEHFEQGGNFQEML